MKTYCVATAIIKDDDKYLIAKRAKTKKIEPGLWEFITGFVEDHEAAEDTIIREMMEEIQVVGVISKQPVAFQMYKKGKRWVVIPFVVSVGSRIVTTDPSEHSEAKWVTWKELEQISDFRYDLDLLAKSLFLA